MIDIMKNMSKYKVIALRTIKHAKKIAVISLCGITTATVQVSHSEAELALEDSKNQNSVAPIHSLTDSLLEKLHNNPQDMKGWVLLAKSYAYMQQNDNAQMAFNKAQALGYTGTSPVISKSNPYDSKHSNYTLDNITNKIAALGDKSNAAMLVSNTLLTQNTKANSESSQKSLTVSLTVASKDKDKVPEDATVFIFARKTEGPPMPLAVVKKSSSDFPISLTLDESMAMMPTHSLSTVEEAIVVARISKSGNASKSPGDWEVVSSPIKLSSGNAKINLTISAP